MAQVTPERQLRDEIGRLRRDIEQVRDELGDTLAALEDRASPKRVAERNKERARARIEAARQSASAAIRSADRRVFVAGAALVLGLLVVRAIRR